MGGRRNVKLLEFDDAKMGDGLSNAVGAYKAILEDGKVLAHYCDSRGSGAFTPMVAAGAAAYIRESIQGKRQVSGLGSLPKLSEDTIKQKGHKNFHYWTGELADNVTHQVTSSGKRQIGYVTMREGWHSSGVYYGALAKWLEHGTSNMPSRPLMHLAIHDFVAKKLPMMLKATKKAIVKSIAYNHQGQKVGTGLDLGALSTINVAKLFKNEDVFKQSAFRKQGKGEARKILNSVGLSSARLDRW